MKKVKNMLENLIAMIENARIRNELELIEQLLINLLGKNKLQWQEALKKLLRKELVAFHHDMLFDPNYASIVITASGGKPKLTSFKQAMGPTEIREELGWQKVRMATTEELISYMGLKQDRDLSAMILSHYGPNQYPCAIAFSKKKNGEFGLGIYDNSNTAKWQPGCKFLVYPL